MCMRQEDSRKCEVLAGESVVRRDLREVSFQSALLLVNCAKRSAVFSGFWDVDFITVIGCVTVTTVELALQPVASHGNSGLSP